MNTYHLPVFVSAEKHNAALAAQPAHEPHCSGPHPTIRRLHLAFVAPAVGVAQKVHSSAAK